jgi:hypothetical protein
MTKLYTETAPYEITYSALSASLLSVLAYFDVFNHPLLAEEIHYYCNVENISIEEINIELRALADLDIIKSNGRYFFLKNSDNIQKRIVENIRSKIYWMKAEKYSKLIAAFPFVRGVCISGSLSKERANETADIDYFIITKPGRLWLCRIMLVLYKKIVLFNSRKYFCINYFVDTNHLSIPDKNIFTATEIVTLMPTYSRAQYKLFMEANRWVKQYYPNVQDRENPAAEVLHETALKNTLERLFDGRFGKACDVFCMKIIKAYGRLRFRKLSSEEYDHRLRSTKGVSKHHPNSFQETVLAEYTKRVRFFEEEFGIKATA